jgi:hypothetical protein
MQLAVASYACPGAQSSRVAEVAAMAEAGMPCAETMSLRMDDEQPHLCQAHCQASQQTADKYELPRWHPLPWRISPTHPSLRLPS